MMLNGHSTGRPRSPSTDPHSSSSQPLELVSPAVSRDIEPQHARSEPSRHSSSRGDCLHHRRDRSYPLQPSHRDSSVEEVCRHSMAARAREADEAEEDKDKDRPG